MASFIRNWLIRGGVLAVIAATIFGVYTAIHWVSPEKVRAAVLAHLANKFDDSVEVSVGSAQMRLFGGLSVTDLTLTRRGEPAPFLTVPNVVIYHDKEKLNRGELAARKIEFNHPTVRVDRLEDGTWSLAALAKPGPSDQSIPTVVANNATVIVTDRRPGGNPPVALTQIKLTVLNDPLPVLKIDGQCLAVAADALDSEGRVPSGVFSIPVTVNARVNRGTGQITAHVETGELEVGPDLAPALASAHPKASTYCQQFSGRVTVKADVTLPGGPDTAIKYDVRFELANGRFENPDLPWPLDHLAGAVRVADGKVSVEKMTGRLGTAAAELTLESKPDLLKPKPGRDVTVPGVASGAGPRRRQPVFAHAFHPLKPLFDPCADDPMAAIEERLERFELKVMALSLDDDLFARLTPGAQKIRRMFNPSGGVDVAVRFLRPDGGWRREVDVTPRGLSIEYQHFHYPVTELSGSLKKVNANDGTDEFQADIRATAGGRRISIKGRVAGEGPDPLIDLTLAGTDIPIDDKLIGALPQKYAVALGKLRANARGNFHIGLKQEYGVNRMDNTFKIGVYNGTVKYTQFPYSLRQVRGDVLIKTVAIAENRPLRPGLPIEPQPDRDTVELKNFEAVHDGGRLWISGDSKAVPDTADRKMVLKVQGENCPIDEEFRESMRALKMDRVLRTFSPRGDITFGADMEVWERGRPAALPDQRLLAASGGVIPVVSLMPIEPPFDPATDLKLSFNFRGPSITPTFFAYDLHQLSGVLRYQAARVELVDFSARHGQSTMKLGGADVRFTDGDGIWANLGEIKLAPLVSDPALLKALPAQLRTGFEQLNVRGPAELTVEHMVVDVPDSKPRKAHGGQDRWHPAGEAPPLTLPFKVARHRPPERPLIASALGLLPFTRPWQPLPTPPAELPDATVYWNASLKMNGAAVDVGATWDDVYGAIASEGRFEGNHLGQVIGNAWIERANIAHQPVSSAKVNYRVRAQQPDPNKPGEYLPPVAEFRDLTGTLFGGTLGGEARVTLAEPLKYRLWLTASGVKLEDVAKHHKLGSGELKGLAQGDVLLENKLDTKSGMPVLTGTGRVDVPQGRLYNLPVLLEMVKVLKGQTPDGAAFDEAHAMFEVLGDKLKVTQVDLLGSAVSLGGSGEMDVTGKDVNFEFYTIWSQTLRRWLATPFGDVAGLLSGGLFKIELTRVNGTLTPKAHMLPVVTDPARAVAERWRNRFDRQANPQPTVRGAPR